MNLIILYYMCQPCHYTQGILLPDCHETKVAMMLANQIDEVCRSNVGRDFGVVQSMFMVITQPFANCKRVVKCHLTYLVFCIVSKPLSVKE